MERERRSFSYETFLTRLEDVGSPITYRWNLFQVGIYPDGVIGRPTAAALRLEKNLLLYNMEISEPQLAKYFTLFLGGGCGIMD